MSIQEITKEAGNFEYNPNTPLRYWLRAADAIQKQVWPPRLAIVCLQALTRSRRQSRMSATATSRTPTSSSSGTPCLSSTSSLTMLRPRCPRTALRSRKRIRP